MIKPLNTRPVLNAFGDGLHLVVMAGLTLASAAVLAIPHGPRAVEAEPIVLPTVVVTAKPSAATSVPRLPTVVVTAKRSAS